MLARSFTVAALLALLTGCTSAANQRTAPTDPVLSPAATDTGGAVRSKSPVAEIDVCTAISPALLEQALGVPFDPGVPGTPGGTLLGECDYVPSPPSASPLATSPTPASGAGATSTAASSAPTASGSVPPGAVPATDVAHVYVAARTSSQYAAMVKAYQLTPSPVGGQQGAFGTTTGLLVHVPFGDYVLQIAVSDAAGTLQQTSAELIALHYIKS